MTVKERLAQLIEAMPEEAAEELLRLAEARAVKPQSRVSAFGKYAHSSVTVDDYLQRKQEEIDREEEQAARLSRGEG
jgi:hypothetical protein